MKSRLRRLASGRLERRHGWWRRQAFPSEFSTAPLGFAGELWRSGNELPGYRDLVVAVKRWGYVASPGYDLTQHLLSDVIDAASAVDYAAEKLVEAVGIAETEMASVLHPTGPRPELGWSVNHMAIADAYIEFGNVLIGIRALADRMERRDPYTKESLGLLPALDPGSKLYARLGGLNDKFVRELAADARQLAAYVLHESRIPYPFDANAAIEDGHLELQIPNRTVARNGRVPPLRTTLSLRYSQRRTVRSFLLRALPIVRSFVDDVLHAFEEEVPARMRPPNP